MKKTASGIVRPVTLGEFSKSSMYTYGTFVLTDRAVADVRDGLKPVHRRILWSMYHLKGAGFKKSAKVVGDTMGSYHPHGDKAIYDTLVNLVGDRYPLVEGHGNFGSPTDSAASMRYTEVRLTPLANELFHDIEVADFVPNYSGDKKEPLVLPSRIPLLLLNGSSGIGVALRASIPPHNLRELVRVLVYYIKKDRPSVNTILKHLPGPDYGYGILLSSPDEVKTLYESGSGSLSYRCDYSFEKTKSGYVLVVKSLAPGFNMGSFLSKMKKLSDEGLILSCSDGTNAEGVRIYVEFSDPIVLKERVIPELHTTQSYQFYVVKRSPEEMGELTEESLFCGGLLRIFEEFVVFRRVVEELRLKRELRIAKSNLSRAKALLAAISNLDKVYDVLKDKHESLDQLVLRLSQSLSIKEKQARFLLEMKVQQLSRMNEDSQKGKIENIRRTISIIKEDLSNIDEVIVRSLKSLLPFSDERGTVLGLGTEPPSIDVKVQKKYIVSSGNKIIRLDKEPSRRHKFDFLCSASSYVTAVLSNNEAHTFSLAYLKEETLSHPIVGIIPDCLPTLAVDSSGKYVAVNTPDKTFKVMRGATTLSFAVPIYPEGKVLFSSDSGDVKVVRGSSIECTRAFVRGKNLFPRKCISKVVSLDKGHRAYGPDASPLSVKNPIPDSVYVLSSNNFLFVKEDKKEIAPLDVSLTLLSSGLVERSFPL